MVASGEEPVLAFLAPASEVAATFDPQRASSPRRLGFATLHFTLRTPHDRLIDEVGNALDDAERFDLPVVLMFDDWNFPDGSWSEDPEIVEWTDWPTTARSGPLLKRRWIEWAPQGNPFPPSPNVASEAFRAWLSPRQRDCFAMIGWRYRSWDAAGRAHLFGGVVVGWETGYYTLLHPDAYAGKEPGPVRTGFAALTHSGYTAEAIKQLSRDTHVAPDAVIANLLFDTLQTYSSWWVGMAVSAGIPASRVYTHYGAFNTGVPVPATLIGDGRLVPLEYTTAPPGRPGLTMTPGWSDPEEASRRYADLGHEVWGAPEIEITEAIRSADGTLGWLERLSSAGANLLCVWGWNDPSTSPYVFRNTPAVEGFRRWLQFAPARR